MTSWTLSASSAALFFSSEHFSCLSALFCTSATSSPSVWESFPATSCIAANIPLFTFPSSLAFFLASRFLSFSGSSLICAASCRLFGVWQVNPAPVGLRRRFFWLGGGLRHFLVYSLLA